MVLDTTVLRHIVHMQGDLEPERIEERPEGVVALEAGAAAPLPDRQRPELRRPARPLDQLRDFRGAHHARRGLPRDVPLVRPLHPSEIRTRGRIPLDLKEGEYRGKLGGIEVDAMRHGGRVVRLRCADA